MRYQAGFQAPGSLSDKGWVESGDLTLRLLPAETCPLSQGWALAEDPNWVLDGKPASPGPFLLAWAWTSEVEGGALRLEPLLSELRVAFVLVAVYRNIMT